MPEPPSPARKPRKAVHSLEGFLDRFLARLPAGHVVGLYLIQADQNNRIGTSFDRKYARSFCDQYVDRLRGLLPKGTVIVRLHERRFAVACVRASVPEAVEIGQSLIDRDEPRMKIGSEKFAIDLTMGIALYPTHADDGGSLIRRAELALKLAKESGLRFELYEPDASSHQRALWKFETELKQAIQRGLLEVHYQPKYHIEQHRIYGAEALVRWRNESGQLVPASAFIDAAENSGVIVPLTWVVFDEIMKSAASFEGVEKPFMLSVNIAPDVLSDREFFARLTTLKVELLRYDTRLTVELTESGLMSNEIVSLEALERIRALGVGLAIDDFGKGYSSLNYLRRIPATELKIDKDFVGSVALDPKNRQIVKTAIELAAAFEMQSVAEGVDSEEGLAALAALDCVGAQGYLISRPMPIETLCEWLRTKKLDFLQRALQPRPARSGTWNVSH
jgi:EAL domain-containing protein (putative c-di-GMP-specific phosphodiesterase class I)/GGDEF domain-containing protein